MKNEFYDVALREKIYSYLEQLQEDVDIWLHYYDYERSHSGKYCYGKTPIQTFLDYKNLALEKNIQNEYLSRVSDSHNLYDNHTHA